MCCCVPARSLRGLGASHSVGQTALICDICARGTLTSSSEKPRFLYVYKASFHRLAPVSRSLLGHSETKRIYIHLSSTQHTARLNRRPATAAASHGGGVWGVRSIEVRRKLVYCGCFPIPVSGRLVYLRHSRPVSQGPCLPRGWGCVGAGVGGGGVRQSLLLLTPPHDGELCC